MNTAALIEELRNEGIIQHQRENSPTMWWIADGTQRFLSFHDESVTLWQNRRPYFVNERIETIPTEQATPQTVAAMIS